MPLVLRPSIVVLVSLHGRSLAIQPKPKQALIEYRSNLRGKISHPDRRATDLYVEWIVISEAHLSLVRTTAPPAGRTCLPECQS